MQIMKLVEKDIRPRDIMTEAAFHNAETVDMALGCSTNTMLHLPAIAHEAEDLLVEHSHTLVDGTGGRIVAAGDVILDKLLEQLLIALGREGVEVESTVEWSPDGVGLRGIEDLVVARLTYQLGKL